MKKLIALTMVVTMGLSVFAGCAKKAENKPVDKPAQTESNQPSETKPQAKVMINIEGVVEEISKDGTKIRIGELWVIIDDNTSFADDPDNGSEEISSKIAGGNFIQGYTEDEGNEVKALSIYVNEKASKPHAKVAVNISGTIEEISEDGTKIKVDGKWIIITEDTRFEDDPDNGTEAVSKEFKIGNRIAGWTAGDPEADEVTADAIYSNN